MSIFEQILREKELLNCLSLKLVLQLVPILIYQAAISKFSFKYSMVTNEKKQDRIRDLESHEAVWQRTLRDQVSEGVILFNPRTQTFACNHYLTKIIENDREDSPKDTPKLNTVNLSLQDFELKAASKFQRFVIKGLSTLTEIISSASAPSQE